MSRKPTKRELRMIAEAAYKQRVGGYTTESDALFALELIQRLTLLLANAGQAAVAGHDKLTGARRGRHTPTIDDQPDADKPRPRGGKHKQLKGTDAMPAKACLGKSDGSGGGRRPRTRRVALTKEPVSSPAAPTSRRTTRQKGK